MATITIGSSPISIPGPRSSPGLPPLESLVRRRAFRADEAVSRPDVTHTGSCAGFRPASSFTKYDASVFEREGYGYSSTAKSTGQEKTDRGIQLSQDDKPSSTSLLPTTFARADHIIHSKKTKRKSKADDQAQIKGKITKPSMVAKQEKSSAFRFPTGMNIAKFMSGNSQASPQANDRNLDIGSANKTAVDDTSTITTSYEPSQTVPMPDLRKSFGYQDETIALKLDVGNQAEGERQTKRARLDVNNEAPSLKQKPRQTSKKSPPKKAVSKSSRTVTGVAIAQRNAPEPEEEATSEQVAKMFSRSLPSPADPSATARFILDPEGSDHDHTITKSKTVKAKKPRKSLNAKTKVVVVPKLLDPDTARRKIDRQEIFFGTSSQLTRDEPLNEICELQQAIADSEAICLDASKINVILETTDPADSDVTEKAKMWSVGARGDGNLLIEAEAPRPAVRQLEQLQDSPPSTDAKSSEVQPKPHFDTSQKLRVAPPSQSPTKSRLMCFEAPRIPLSPLELNKPAFTQAPTSAQQTSRALSTTKPLSVVERPTTNVPAKDANAKPAKKPRGRPRKDASASETSPKNKAGPEKSSKTQIEGSVDDELNVKVTNDLDGIKAVDEEDKPAKKKPGPKKGWKKALAKPLEDPTKTNEEKMKITTAHNTSVVEDIEDTEPRAASTPRRRRQGSQAPPTPPLQLELSPSQEARREAEEPTKKPRAKRKAKAKHASSKDKEVLEFHMTAPVLFPLITRAVRSTPPSDLMRPTWHEKILLYDPIVLEDLTDWLNSGSLTEASKEQDPKAEFEWHGDVKAWMVQRWCEEHSICCLWREGLRGGVKAKY